MAKTEKELQELKEKVQELNKELKELSNEELQQVSGGTWSRADGDVDLGRVTIVY